MQWWLDVREIPLGWWPGILSTVALSSVLLDQGPYVPWVCASLIGLCLGEMMRRTEAAAARIGDVHHVGHGDPQAAMRAAARWGSDVLGRVARGQAAAEAVAGAALVEMQEGQAPSEAGSAVSEQELSGFHNGHNGHDSRPHSTWIHNALRSVTPTGDGVTPRDIARMGTVPEDIPYHGQPLVAVPPVRRTHSPPRVGAAAAAGSLG